MPFGLRNVGVTYQRMMTRIFEGMIGAQVKVYIDDIITKTPTIRDHVVNLEAFSKGSNNMWLNPLKCTFAVSIGKFLGYILTNRGIEAHPNKCKVVLELKSPTTVKEVQKLNGKITALSRFMPKVAHRALPFYLLIWKDSTFEWSEACKNAF